MTVALVVGSLHMDLIATSTTLPAPGASVTGESFTRSPGGKAGNQAVQLARLGIPTALVARVGSDPFGDELTAAMSDNGVDTSRVVRDPALATGASTVLSAAGEYLSIIVPGASATLRRSDLDDVPSSIEVVVAQLELPADVYSMVAEWATDRRVPLILNASPLPPYLDATMERIIASAQTIAVNRAEASLLAQREVASAPDAHLAAEAIMARLGTEVVLITLGSSGALCRHPAGIDYHPAWPVGVVDTVGSGDAFLATFVASRLEGRSIPLALERATAAGAIACTRPGTLAGLASSEELDAFQARGPVYRNLSRGSQPKTIRQKPIPGRT